MKIDLPYGKGRIQAQVPDDRVSGVIHSRLDDWTSEFSEEELIDRALLNPIGSPRLKDLARDARNIVIICSDHTRPVPSKRIIPPMLREIRDGNPEADITLLIATGCHRETTKAELVEKFGEEIVSKEKILVHDCLNGSFVSMGTLPSGGELKINEIAANADLLAAEGFIEPHFFAGYSGGRKSVLPGVAAAVSVWGNHCSSLIADPNSRCGVLDGNPIHEDMAAAARMAGLKFIVNVVINSEKEVIGAFAGDGRDAHLAGCRFLDELCRSEAPKADIVITTNNGYPLDQNIYQAVKGMTTAEAVCRPGGIIIMAAECGDGIGGDEFYRTFKNHFTAGDVMKEILNTPQDKTVPDQWQSQIFARVLMDHPVIFVSSADEETVRDLHMIPAARIEDALKKADELLGYRGNVLVIPEGISNILRAEES
ncbi:nickel-dependent lactate racemase [Clostridium sp. MCC353]|uniref:nickel-dependent lactate racemase n=1 Tax=Clostridium sp. MCC353 TaxID=2592646 RepID=UPI001C037B91|nr:nickel-dependent lactate racemase [Clostridium sp. MCC353]MBT9776539.1 nickel-dependent lactate racemase [Clostridium sp. MCC353]